jgi:type 1 glutamine amidotransferase
VFAQEKKTPPPAELVEFFQPPEKYRNDKDFPVTWVNTYKGARYFYTSLGAPEDFQQKSMKRLLANAVFWTTQRDPERMKK